MGSHLSMQLTKTMGTKHIYPVFKAEIDAQGKMVIINRERMGQFIRRYPGKTMGVTIKPYRKPRGRQEEKYYHAVPKMLVAEAMDLEPEEAHAFLCKLFLTIEEMKIINGKEVRYTRVRGSSELDSVQYSDFNRSIRMWASLPTGDNGLNQTSGLELYIPEPNEADYENYF